MEVGNDDVLGGLQPVGLGAPRGGDEKKPATGKLSKDGATPANSAPTFAKSTKKPVTITKNVGRKPNSSRIRSDRPLPVMTPMRAHISSVTYKAMVMGMSDQ